MELKGMTTVLADHNHGSSHGDLLPIAAAWIAAGMSAADAERWIAIDVWNPQVAAAFERAGLRQDQITAARDLLGDEVLDGRRPNFDYGDAIFSVCDGETPVDVMIAAAKLVD